TNRVLLKNDASVEETRGVCFLPFASIVRVGARGWLSPIFDPIGYPRLASQTKSTLFDLIKCGALTFDADEEVFRFDRFRVFPRVTLRRRLDDGGIVTFY